jgi:hypothetical protein
MPVHNEQYLASQYFVYARKLIAHAVLHAGLGLVGLAKVIKEYLIEDDIDHCLKYLSVEDIPDLDIQNKIKQVMKSFCHYQKNQENFCMYPILFDFYVLTTIK